MYEDRSFDLARVLLGANVQLNVDRAHMRIESTVSTFTAAMATLIHHLPSNSFRRSICHALTRGAAR
jgi:hypothetical protein